MFEIVAFLGIFAIAAVIVRRVLDAKGNRRNAMLLARRHDLDDDTAARLYEVARQDGFGSAWVEVVEHPAPIGRAQRRPSEPSTRKLPERHRA